MTCRRDAWRARRTWTTRRGMCYDGNGPSPLVELIRGEVETARNASLPSSAVGKAANYTLSLWPRLARFLDHPELELSNNLAENSMRPIALGRKNWIHIGSRHAGPKVAAILSVVETCRRMAYFDPRLPGRHIARPR